MNYRFQIALGFAISFSLLLPGYAQSTSDLPAGYYIYVGSKLGETPPKAVIIDSKGRTSWLDDSSGQSQKQTRKTVSPMESSPAETTGQLTHATDQSANWESYNYPLIKWKTHSITTDSSGAAQLTTTFETTHTGYGTLKYKLIFKGKPLLNYASRSVQLLDTNGFKLKEIDINSYSFHPVPGTALWEATGDVSCYEKDYRPVSDYTVN